jgi:ATP-binding protein involved in chromosome partitioning
MAYFTPAELPNNRYYIFGKEGCKKLAKEANIPLLGEIPLVQGICESGDTGKPVTLSDDENPETIAFKALAENIIARVKVIHE